MKTIVMFIMSIFMAMNLHAYSYAASGKEPTLEAKEAILKALNSDDFTNAQTVFNKYEANYKYLNDEFNPALLNSLKTALNQHDKAQIVKWLDISIACEIQRRLDGGLKNIQQFNVAKVMLAKANKFYKILSVSLDKKQNDALNNAIKKCIESIGNPGLFGVGAKPVNKEEYIKNQKIAIEILHAI